MSVPQWKAKHVRLKHCCTGTRVDRMYTYREPSSYWISHVSSLLYIYNTHGIAGAHLFVACSGNTCAVMGRKAWPAVREQLCSAAHSASTRKYRRI